MNMYMPGLDTSYMQTLNQQRLTGLNLARETERISSGMRINRGADDPSGLAISSGMAAQLRGIATAMGNIQDGIFLIRTADSALNEVQSIALRMRDLAVRGANEATLYTPPSGIQPGVFCDTQVLWKEIMTLSVGINRIKTTAAGNGKTLLDGEFASGQTLQIGPDNVAAQQVDVVLPDMDNYGWPNYIPPPPWNDT